MGFFDRLFGAKQQAVPEQAKTKEQAPQKEEVPAAPSVAEEVKPEAVEVEEAVVETAPAADEGQVSAEAPWGAHLQKRLDTYFARLRQEFPNGEVVRLNTGHKKLAERGAELRRLIGYEGDLDGFFALGGFTYVRSVGGRPTLPAAQTASVENRLRELFPEDVPTLTAVQQKDHRLYLDLRAAARREGCTVGDYLNQFKEQ